MASIFHKIAGVSGAVAIALGAYGSHGNSFFFSPFFLHLWKSASFVVTSKRVMEVRFALVKLRDFSIWDQIWVTGVTGFFQVWF